MCVDAEPDMEGMPHYHRTPIAWTLPPMLIHFHDSIVTPWRRTVPTDFRVSVTWRPAQTTLHYPELYNGVCEYLRAPPDKAKWPDAARYLRAIKRCYHPSNTLQRDRILWTQAWIATLDMKDCSDADTDADNEE